MVHRTHLEFIRSLVFRGHVGEGLENLLQSRLGHRVLTDGAVLLEAFDLAKHESDSFVFPGNSQLEEVRALLQHLNGGKARPQEGADSLETILKGVDVLHDVPESDFALTILLALHL